MKIEKILYVVYIVILGLSPSKAQSGYIDKKYNYTVEKDLSYGTAIDYAGKLDTLEYDIYKPIGDGNTRRPILIAVHGGAWIAGTKNDGSTESICKEMAARGYVAVAVNYRLGMHLSASGGAAATCPVALDNRIYIADSMEVVRAIYRGMQDVKAAIRFFKARYQIDSTCAENIYLCGESAGSFICYNTILMNSASKKYKACESIADAPTPHSSLTNYLPQGYSLKRPDLGDVEGNLNSNGYNTKVKGVAGFFGAVLDMNLFKNIDTPYLYLFHQTSDVVVDCGKTNILAGMSYNCLDPLGFMGCKHIYNMPLAWGSCALVDSIKKSNYDTAKYINDIVYNTGPNCLQNPPGHSIDNIALRCKNIANLFAKPIKENENKGNCQPLMPIEVPKQKLYIECYPNPISDQLNIYNPSGEQGLYHTEILNAEGQVLYTNFSNQVFQEISTQQFSQGIYLVRVYNLSDSVVYKLVKQ